MNRRGFLGSILALGAAPAIVRASSLMKLALLRPPGGVWVDFGSGRMYVHSVRSLQNALHGFDIHGVDYIDSGFSGIRIPNPYPGDSGGFEVAERITLPQTPRRLVRWVPVEAFRKDYPR